MKCPPHRYEKWRLVQFFYQGLSQPNHSMIELMNGEAFLNLTGDLAYKALEKITANSQDWDFTSCRDKICPKERRHPGAKRRARVDSKDGCHCQETGCFEYGKAC
jgi:hypothetical protein